MTIYNWPVVRSLNDFEEFLKRIASDRLAIYRGQDSDWPLRPYIGRRRPKNGTFINMEGTIFKLFKKKASNWLDDLPTNDWDWLALAQHNRLATRLLDWTQDPFIALWFALRTTPSDRKFAPEVWVLTPEKRDVIDMKEMSSPFKGTRTKVFLPSKRFTRIQVQKGAFTVFKHIPRFSRQFVALERNKLLRRKLQRARLSAHCRNDLLQDLDRKGINENTMFPDLDKLGRQLVRKYTRPVNKGVKKFKN